MNNLFTERGFSLLGMIIFSVDTRVNSSLMYCREYTILLLFFLFFFLGEISYTATLFKSEVK